MLSAAKHLALGATAAAALAALLLPLVLHALGLDFYVSTAGKIVVFAIAATSLNLVLGYGGMVSFGHAAFFGLGAYATGVLMGPLLAVQVGMGENILILAFVVIVICGIGSIRGALVGALLVGVVDTFGRTVLQALFREFLPPQMASAAGPAVASVAIYVFMAVVLAVRPQGLFPARG